MQSKLRIGIILILLIFILNFSFVSAKLKRYVLVESIETKRSGEFYSMRLQPGLALEINEDILYPVNFKSFNGSHIFLELGVSSKDVGKMVPMRFINKTDKREAYNLYKEMNTLTKEEQTISIIELSKYNVEWGFASSTLNLTQTNDGFIEGCDFDENDNSIASYVEWEYCNSSEPVPTGEVGYYKFNLSGLVDNATHRVSVFNATFSVFRISGTTGIPYWVYYWSNQSWTESGIDPGLCGNGAYCSEVTATMEELLGKSVFGSGRNFYSDYNLTQKINNTYLTNKNFTLIVNLSNNSEGHYVQTGAEDYAGSSEYYTFLDLNYTIIPKAAGGGPVFQTVSLNITNNTKLNWSDFYDGYVGCRFNSSNMSADNISLHINVTSHDKVNLSNNTWYGFNNYNFTVGLNWVSCNTTYNNSLIYNLTLTNNTVLSKYQWMELNITNNTAVNYSVLRYFVGVQWHSWNYTTRNINLYINDTLVTNANGINSSNVSFDLINITTIGRINLTVNNTFNTTQHYWLNITNTTTPPVVVSHYQWMELNITNNSLVNISALLEYVGVRWHSWNHTSRLIDLYINNTWVTNINGTNNTWVSFNLTNISTIGIINITANNSLNHSGFYYLNITNTSGTAHEEDKTGYVAVALLVIAVMFFLVFVADKMGHIILNTGLGFGVPVIKYFLLIIDGWIGLGLLSFALGIIENESYRNLGGVQTIYSAYVYLLIIITTAWMLALLVLSLKHLSKWGERIV